MNEFWYMSAEGQATGSIEKKTRGSLKPKRGTYMNESWHTSTKGQAGRLSKKIPMKSWIEIYLDIYIYMYIYEWVMLHSSWGASNDIEYIYV